MASTIDLRSFGVESRESFSLSAIYTPLYAKPRTFERPPPQQTTNAARPLLETVIQRTRASLVVGESGAGKTTFMLHLCTALAGDSAFGVPFYLDLGASPFINESRLDERGRFPWQILPEMLQTRYADLGVDMPASDIDALARESQTTWLIDALNEIYSEELRSALTDAIQECMRRWPQARFVLTSSEAGIRGYGAPVAFQRVDIDEFRQPDIEAFLQSFLTEQLPESTLQEREEVWQPLATAIRDSPELEDLAKSPLRLTALTLKYMRDGRLPDSRAEVLRGAVEWFIHKKAPVLRPHVRSGRDLRRVFAELAYQMFTGGEVPRNRVGLAWATERIAPLGCFQGSAEDFLEAAVSAGGLIVRRGNGDLRMHDALRDYLAASRIASRTDDPSTGWWAEIAPHLDDPLWHNVISLVPDVLLLGGSERVDLFLERLGASSEGQPDQSRLVRVALGGRILHELGLSGYRPTSTPKWNASINTVPELLARTSGFPIEQRYGAAVAHGITGDQRLTDPAAGWVAIQAGSFWMGAQSYDPDGPNFDADAAAWEGPVREVQVGEFSIRRFPVAVVEYAEFVADGGYTPGARLWGEQGLQWLLRTGVSSPAEWKGQRAVPNAPVSGLSWHEANAYCRWLSLADPDAYLIRLPSEQEWEYAARHAHPNTIFPWGIATGAADWAEANWAASFLRRKTPVGMFPASTTADGIADLFGNVEEWCQDSWITLSGASGTSRKNVDTPTMAPALNDGATSGGLMRVVRGGSCIRFPRLCRPTYRSRIGTERRYLTVGFRPVRLASVR